MSSPADIGAGEASSSSNTHGRLVIPTQEELDTLPHIVAKLPWTSYLLCIMDFAERASFWGFRNIFQNFIRAPLPAGGNGAGAPPRGTQQTAGALGLGTVVASAMIDAFGILAYGFPVLGGWVADVYLGRFRTMYIGAVVMGAACIILVVSSVPAVLATGHAVWPFAIGMYSLCLGTGVLKASVSPAILDQSPHKRYHVVTLKNGERAIVDPERTTSRMMTWMFLALQFGGLMGIPTSYLARYVGFWAAYLLPTIVWLSVPGILLWINTKPLVKVPPGGSDLGNVVRVHLLCLRRAGLRGIGRSGFYAHAKPSVLAAAGDAQAAAVPWDDRFVDEVRRTMQACAVFCFIPMAMINNGGLGAAANAQSASLTSNGVPNDLLDNLNPITTITTTFAMSYIIVPQLRKLGIKFGPVRSIFVGSLFATVGSSSYAIIQHYVYQTSPCGYSASTCTEGTGVSPLSLWLVAIPVVTCAPAEPLIYVPAFSLAYARSPPNMKGLVMGLSLFTLSVAQLASLIFAGLVHDPNLVWVFAVPPIIGFFVAMAFWYLFRHLDDEEFYLGEKHTDDQNGSEPYEVGGGPEVTEKQVGNVVVKT